MKKRYSGPQIVVKLRQVDVLIGQGKAVPGPHGSSKLPLTSRLGGQFACQPFFFLP